GLRRAVVRRGRDPHPAPQSGDTSRLGNLYRYVRGPCWFGSHVDGPPGEEMVDLPSLIQRPACGGGPSGAGRISVASATPQRRGASSHHAHDTKHTSRREWHALL